MIVSVSVKRSTRYLSKTYNIIFLYTDVLLSTVYIPQPQWVSLLSGCMMLLFVVCAHKLYKMPLDLARV
jgi:hypothetical protein